MSRGIQVKGLAELDRYLSALPANLQKNAYRAGLVAAARPVRDRARQLARKASGKMARSIKTGSARLNRDGTVGISIRLTGEHSFIGLFQEYGVQPHLITATPEGKTRMSIRSLNRAVRRGSLRIGENFVGPVIMHPGHSASPFMRPALDMEAEAAVRAFAGRVRSYIEGKTGFALSRDEAV